MMEKLQAGAAFPVTQVARSVGGTLTLGEGGGWKMLVVGDRRCAAHAIAGVIGCG